MTVSLDAAAIEEHAKRVEVDGYTIVENAIDLDLIDKIADDLARLEYELDTQPAANSRRGLTMSGRFTSAAISVPITKPPCTAIVSHAVWLGER